VSDSTSYNCICLTSFTGTRCQSLINPCLLSNGPAVCKNNGVCQIDTTKNPYFICSCQSGFYGDTCQFAVVTPTTTTQSSNIINICSRNICVYSVSCVDIITEPFYRCTCQAGYSGPNCDIS
jgi:hypothetical protein